MSKSITCLVVVIFCVEVAVAQHQSDHQVGTTEWLMKPSNIRSFSCMAAAFDSPGMGWKASVQCQQQQDFASQWAKFNLTNFGTIMGISQDDGDGHLQWQHGGLKAMVFSSARSDAVVFRHQDGDFSSDMIQAMSWFGLNFMSLQHPAWFTQRSIYSYFVHGLQRLIAHTKVPMLARTISITISIPSWSFEELLYGRLYERQCCPRFFIN